MRKDIRRYSNYNTYVILNEIPQNVKLDEVNLPAGKAGNLVRIAPFQADSPPERRSRAGSICQQLKSLNDEKKSSFGIASGIFRYTISIIVFIVISTHLLHTQPSDPLVFPFDKKYGQIEVGGPFAGVEFHKSRPLPSRISFYYPVANSIDLSKDYWKRDESRPLSIGVKIGAEKKKWIGRDGWRYALSPNKVTFYDQDMSLDYELTYEFCLNKPAMVVTLKLKNRLEQRQKVSVYTQLALSLRTCQTYARFDSSLVSYTTNPQAVAAQFSAPETQKSGLFVMNAGERASNVRMDADGMGLTDDGKSLWQDSTFISDTTGVRRQRGAAMFEYVKDFQPGEVMTIVQVIGTSKENDVTQVIADLSTQWREDADRYNDFVRTTSSTDTYFRTNDPVIDRSLLWSKALLSTNAHYLNGHVVPMPCPAEYNFFFTHDLLMTNLGAVNYDLPRVKRDLEYVVSLAKDSIIPHAYYWRDTGFTTEFCTPSNWNHLWFIELSSSYLRHSFDTATVRRLYPFVTKSLTEVMTQLRSDDLMHAFRPDWWDLGWKEGSRTYITALSIRAIEDYLFISSIVDPGNKSLLQLEKNAGAMRRALVTKLWDDSLRYLINYNGTEKDNHLYMGSLIAPAFHLLDRERSDQLIATAKKSLLAPTLGIRAVMPSDFHKDSVIKYFVIAGNEAGDEYTYINGGVWPHNNAWFALALNSAGRSNEALSFVKEHMTIDGIAASRNGIPALFEYRYSNEASPRFGEIDKPSFLWAGGFYLYTVYTLAGLTDNVWNLSISEDRAQFDSTVRCSYSFGGSMNVMIGGQGKRLESMRADGKTLASLVLPIKIRSSETVSAVFGKSTDPYLTAANAVVHSAEYSSVKKQLVCSVSSFNGHRTSVNVAGTSKPRRVLLNGKRAANVVSTKNADGMVTIDIAFVAGRSTDVILLQW